MVLHDINQQDQLREIFIKRKGWRIFKKKLIVSKKHDPHAKKTPIL